MLKRWQLGLVDNDQMKPRVILIRENPETLTCSSCAGTLEGIDAFGSSEVPDYAPIRRVMNRVGDLYLALRREFGERVEIDVVDPRNEVYLIPILLGDYRRYHPPLGVFLKTLFLGISPESVIVNGRAMHVGELPAPGVLVEEVSSFLEASQPPQP
ncbi:MAG: hypothetical protein ACE5JU_04870 [Candidatus Binatia bacterium]